MRSLFRTAPNCTYPRGDQSNNGIYVDGGADTIIEHNVVGRTDLGIELQSENGELIRNVEVQFNVVFNSNYTNWVLGPNDGCSEHDHGLFDDPELASPDLESNERQRMRRGRSAGSWCCPAPHRHARSRRERRGSSTPSAGSVRSGPPLRFSSP